jgi:hypothetical protein
MIFRNSIVLYCSLLLTGGLFRGFWGLKWGRGQGANYA